MAVKVPFRTKNSLVAPAGSSTQAGGLTLTSGTLKSNPTSSDSGSIEYDGTNLSIIDSSGSRRTFAYNDSTISVNSQSSSYTLVSGDVGKLVSIASSSLNVPSSTFNSGSVIIIYNNTSTNMTVSPNSGVTLYKSGTSTTGSINLYPRSIAYLTCVDTNTFVLSSSGIV